MPCIHGADDRKFNFQQIPILEKTESQKTIHNKTPFLTPYPLYSFTHIFPSDKPVNGIFSIFCIYFINSYLVLLHESCHHHSLFSRSSVITLSHSMINSQSLSSCISQ